MIWEREPLWTKARLFMEYARDEEPSSPKFGLWCSLGLELLARSAVASISPTLLAEPDNEHKHLLFSLGRSSTTKPNRSISARLVFALCAQLFEEFTVEDLTLARALLNRRNEELHTGAAAFAEFPSNDWLAGFYHACRSLCLATGESLETLFGAEEAEIATDLLDQAASTTKKQVMDLVAAHRKVFEQLDEDQQASARQDAEDRGRSLSVQRHHCVPCPSCGSVATVQGRAFGKEFIDSHDDEIVVKQAVSPTSFSCSACGLSLNGYAQLNAADRGDQYTRTTKFAPDEYYGLIHPDDLAEHVYEFIESGELREYDNE